MFSKNNIIHKIVLPVAGFFFANTLPNTLDEPTDLIVADDRVAIGFFLSLLSVLDAIVEHACGS